MPKPKDKSAGFESLTDDDEDDTVDTETETTPSENLYNLQGMKMICLLFIVFIFIMSDFFADKVLGNISGTTQNLALTNKGVFLASLVGCLLSVAIYGLVHANVI
jgi:hypothetical protein